MKTLGEFIRKRRSELGLFWARGGRSSAQS